MDNSEAEREKEWRMSIFSKVGTLLKQPCPECGHHELWKPKIRLTDYKPGDPTPIACTYCGYHTTASRNLGLEHDRIQDQMFVSKSKHYFNYYSVQANQDDSKKTLSAFQTPTTKLRHIKASARSIADRIVKHVPVHAFLIGDTGVGKTHLAYGIINEVEHQTHHNRKIILLNMLQLAIIHNKSIHDDQTRKWFDLLVDQFDRADLIVIDDLGREPNNNWSKEIVDYIANVREDKSLIITSNSSVYKRYSGATLSRLKSHHKGNVIIFRDVNSYREKV